MVTLEPASKVSVERLQQSRKQDFEITSTDDGLQIASRRAQRRNADSPRIESLEPDSNVKVESLAQQSKQDFAITSTDEGMQID
jgi:hypothetical protein